MFPHCADLCTTLLTVSPQVAWPGCWGCWWLASWRPTACCEAGGCLHSAWRRVYVYYARKPCQASGKNGRGEGGRPFVLQTGMFRSELPRGSSLG